MSIQPSKNPMAQAEAIFRRMLAKGEPVALEDALRIVVTPDGFDRRAFGSIPLRMQRDEEIVRAGFRDSKTAKHHGGTKKLWVLADSPRGQELLGGGQ